MPKTLPATKHFKLAQQLRKEIQRMHAGDSLPTVKELREGYDVSQATVERALDRLRGEGLIVRPAGQLRYTVAEIRDPATHRIALIRPDYPSPTFEELSRIIIEAGKQKDWAFELVSFRSLQGLNLRQAMGDNDAAVFLPTSEPFPDHLLAALKRPQHPVVVIQDPPPGLRISSVKINDHQIGQASVEYLRSLGHRRILLVYSEPPCPSADLRAGGWREAMLAGGEQNLDELIVNSHARPFTNTLIESYNCFSRWLDAPHPEFTGVFCPAWTGAIAVLRALRERSIRVPEHVSVIGHGGEGYIAPFMYPALTALETDIQHYGRLVISALQNQVEKPDAPIQHLTIPSKLVIRDSTGPVKMGTSKVDVRHY